MNIQNKKPNMSRKPDDKSGSGNNQKPKFNVYWIYGIIGLAILGTYFLRMGGGAEEITRRQFETEMLASYDVEKIIIVNKEKVEIYIKEDRLASGKYKDAG
ncbi:peptidase M41, partial [Bacteroidota bacterium]